MRRLLAVACLIACGVSCCSAWMAAQEAAEAEAQATKLEALVAFCVLHECPRQRLEYR